MTNNEKKNDKKTAAIEAKKQKPKVPAEEDYDHEMFNSKAEEDAYCEECVNQLCDYREIGDSAQYPHGHI